MKRSGSSVSTHLNQSTRIKNKISLCELVKSSFDSFEKGLNLFLKKLFLKRNAHKIFNFGGDRETININICQG